MERNATLTYVEIEDLDYSVKKGTTLASALKYEHSIRAFANILFRLVADVKTLVIIPSMYFAEGVIECLQRHFKYSERCPFEFTTDTTTVDANLFDCVVLAGPIGFDEIQLLMRTSVVPDAWFMIKPMEKK